MEDILIFWNLKMTLVFGQNKGAYFFVFAKLANWKTTSIFWQMEDNRIFGKMEDNFNISAKEEN